MPISLDKLRKKWGNLIFRRVKYVTINSLGRRNTTYSCPEYCDFMSQDTSYFSHNEMERNVSFYAEDFTVYTTPSILRSNDTHNIILKAHSSNYAELDWEKGGTLYFCPNVSKNKLIQIPRSSKLICGLVDSNNTYKVWFTCSEQFYKLWTCVMYGNKVYPRRNSYNQLIRKMRCNTYEEWVLRNPDSNMEERYNRFHIIRTEKVSKNYFYIYQALATLLFEPEKLENKNKEWGNTFPGNTTAIVYLSTL